MAGIWEKLIARRWIAGPSISDAIERSKIFNLRNIATILNYLGESYTERQKVSNAVAVYLKLIDAIKLGKVNASISLKPTQLGLSISYGLFESNYARILSKAASSGIFTWLDMEEHVYIDDTIKAYMRHISPSSGICIQANMKRSAEDVRNILERKGIIRLVKGAYTGSEKIQYQSKSEVDNNFIKLMKYIFLNSRTFMVATHDTRMIELGIKLNKRYRRNVTFAMLNGIRNRLALELAQKESVAMYVPFGKEWVAYSYRRLREAGHVKIILRSLLEKQGI
ncbi:MAG: proline dehydrogenase family protein [Candidatus Micrarchaeia archaeon]